MRIFVNGTHAVHAGQQEMYRGRLVPCHEVPQRLDHVLAELERRPLAALEAAPPPSRAVLEKVHSPAYLRFLESAWAEWLALDPANQARDAFPSVWPVRGFRHDREPLNFAARMGLYSFDTGTPLTAGTWQAAWEGAGCAMAAARAVGTGGDAARAGVALTRPPGHHAGHDFFGGYCFINNAAVAAQTLRELGAKRVAVLDVDYHHGNGTQSIFYGRSDVLTVSIHGDPVTEYPFFLGHADETGEGDGVGCNINLPLPVGTGTADWMHALEAGVQHIRSHGAEALVVALGVDTFEGDPISSFTLASDDYLAIGRRLEAMKLPTVFTLEGGYAVEDFGVNVVNVLDGFRAAAVARAT
ncbi:histone deacetylase family protein [Hydrogenophaga sp. 5NK40-0174]|uniref:histone deacetylase family protein n=1 Tax=Hydrogenophaga sp. 5NK40-0174 TaxID=3127649 RepID=UPI00310C6C04